MREIATVVTTSDYGKVHFRLGEVLKTKNASKTALARLANVDYRVIKRMADGDPIKVDLDILARVCYVLECSVADLMEYAEP